MKQTRLWLTTIAALLCSLTAKAQDEGMDISYCFSNTDFERGNTEEWTWRDLRPGCASTAAANNYQGVYFMESWCPSTGNLGDFDWSQTAYLTNGYYMIKVLAHAIKTEQSVTPYPYGVYVYAENEQTMVTTTTATEYTVLAKVTDGSLTIGFRGISCDVNWVACDHFRVIRCYGDTEDAALTSWMKYEMRKLVDDIECMNWNFFSDGLVNEIETAIYEDFEAVSSYSEAYALWQRMKSLKVRAEECVAVCEFFNLKIGEIRYFVENNNYFSEDEYWEIDDEIHSRANYFWDDISFYDADRVRSLLAPLYAKILSCLVEESPNVISLFVSNPTLRNDYEGWESDKSSKPTIGDEVAEFFDCDFDLHQRLVGIPNGWYTIKVKGFYRASNNDKGEGYKNGNEQITAELYANNKSVPLQSLYKYTASEMGLSGGSGVLNNYIDRLGTANEAFKNHYYAENEVLVCVQDGTLTFGLRNNEHDPNSWCAFRDFELYYGDKRISGPLSFIIDTDTTVCVVGCDATYSGSLDIPEVINLSGERFSVTSIGDAAFMDCSRLTSITLPEGVTSIGSSAFSGCNSLTAITIPEGVTSIGKRAFLGCSSLTSIYLPDSATSIGSSAFYNCSSLTRITLPEGVTSIGSSAFHGCSSLTSITIPESVTSIGSSAFSGCSNLTSITIPEGVTSIGSSAFYNCSSLTSITLPEGVTSIGSSAFDNCSSLTSITIPEGVTSIGSFAFYKCSRLTSITLPESVTSIEDYAFYECSRFTSITLPESVTSIGDHAFYFCSNLTAVHISSIEAWCKISFSDYFSNPFSHAINLYLNGELVTELVVPEGVTEIGNYAFCGCNSLVSITLPEGVTSIGDAAFMYCSSLTAITIPESVTSIGDEAFRGCRRLTAITIPEGVTSIGYAAFRDCSSLTSITIPEGVTIIGYYAFGGCTSLKELLIEDGSTTLRLVYNSISYSGTGEDLFYDCPLESVYLGRNLSYNTDYNYGYSPFCDKTKLTDLTIGSNVTSIGDNAFRGCSSLTSITLPESVTSIGDEAFYNCFNLKTVINYSDLDIQKGSSSNGYVAYYADIAFNVDEFIGDYAFNTKNGVHYLTGYMGVDTELTLPEDYQGENYQIGSYAFYNCSSLTSIIIPESVTSIGNQAFSGCSSLVSLTIGTNVDSYGSDVFAGCTSVEELMVKGSVMPMVPSDKFTTIRMFSPGPLDTEEFDAKVYRTATLYVPKGSLARYQVADVWKKFWYIEEFDPNEEIEVTLDRTTVTMTEGDVITLVATIIPQYIKDKTVAWTTSDAAIATVDNGVVTAVSEGTATITAKAGDKEATCVVTVSIPTGVGQLTMDNGQWTIYDLTGRKVENPAKGIYIVGGKKVVLQ